jgi:hypothetical protein
MLPDTSEHLCRVSRVTTDAADFLSDMVPPFGLPIVAYIGDLGRVVGLSNQRIEGGFTVKFTMTGAARDKFEAKLKQRGGRKPAEEAVQHRAPRFEPSQSKSQIALSDGRVYPCEVLDISLSGAAVKADIMPTLGTYVALGKMRGRIVRYTDQGMAIEFVKPLDRATLAAELK